jgi:hypothetical protein
VDIFFKGQAVAIIVTTWQFSHTTYSRIDHCQGDLRRGVRKGARATDDERIQVLCFRARLRASLASNLIYCYSELYNRGLPERETERESP